MHQDILDRLRLDPGKRTLGELLQEREAAAFEIVRLRKQIERMTAARTLRSSKDENVDRTRGLQRGMLIRLADVCQLLGVSRSTVYKWMNEGVFPAPVRVSERAVRWRSEDIEAWRESLAASAS